MSSKFVAADYAPFIPRVLEGFGVRPSGCVVSAARDKDGTMKMSYTLNWRSEDHCSAMASLSLNNDASESRKSRHRRRSSRHSESRSVRSSRSHRPSSGSRRHGTGNRTKENKKQLVEQDSAVARRHRSSETVLRKGGITPQPITDGSVVGIPSPTTKLVEVHLEVYDRPPDATTNRCREMRREVTDKERLMTCIEKMLDAMGAPMKVQEHKCPVRLYYKRKEKLRPISFDDYRKMSLNNFHALDGTLNFLVDKVKAIDA